MQKEDVDGLAAERAKRTIDAEPDGLSRPVRDAVDPVSALRRENDVAPALEEPAEAIFGGPVASGGIEEGDSSVEGRMNHRPSPVVVDPEIPEGTRAETQ